MDSVPLITRCTDFPFSTLLLAGIVLGGALFCVAIAKRVFGLMIAGGALALCAGLTLIIQSVLAGQTSPRHIARFGRSIAHTAAESMHDGVQCADRARKTAAAPIKEMRQDENTR